MLINVEVLAVLFLMTHLVDDCLICLELRAIKVYGESERLRPLFFFFLDLSCQQC